MISVDSSDNPVQTMLSVFHCVCVCLNPPKAHVTRLSSSFQTVMACKLKPNQNLIIFESHFRGLVAEHLVHPQRSPSSQTRQFSPSPFWITQVSMKALWQLRIQISSNMRNALKTKNFLTRASHKCFLSLLLRVLRYARKNLNNWPTRYLKRMKTKSVKLRIC